MSQERVRVSLSAQSKEPLVRKQEECEVCGKKVEEIVFEYVNCGYSPELRLRVCGDCMNLLGNQDWDKLTEIAKKRKRSDSV